MLLALALAACGRDDAPARPSAPAEAPSASPSATPQASATPQPPAAASSSAKPDAPSSPRLAPLEAINARCCAIDRTEGTVGPDKGINARYSGDFLRKKNGDRLLFPDDLIADTRELYQYAKSRGAPLYQERRMKVVGEGARYVSVEIEEKGDTGASNPFAHSKCKTLDLRSGKQLKLADVASKAASALETEARARFDALPDHGQFTFVSASFALVGDPARRVRFCNPRRDEALGMGRLDVEVELKDAALDR